MAGNGAYNRYAMQPGWANQTPQSNFLWDMLGLGWLGPIAHGYGLQQDSQSQTNAGGLGAGYSAAPMPGGTPFPTQPVYPGFYNVLNEYMFALQNARELGIAPPQEATPEAIMRWKAQMSPWGEQQILNRRELPLLFKTRGQTVGI